MLFCKKITLSKFVKIEKIKINDQIPFIFSLDRYFVMRETLFRVIPTISIAPYEFAPGSMTHIQKSLLNESEKDIFSKIHTLDWWIKIDSTRISSGQTSHIVTWKTIFYQNYVFSSQAASSNLIQDLEFTLQRDNFR